MGVDHVVGRGLHGIDQELRHSSVWLGLSLGTAHQYDIWVGIIVRVIVRVEMVIGVIGIAKAVEAEVEKVPVKAPKVTTAPAKTAAIEATVTPQTTEGGKSGAQFLSPYGC